MIKKLLFSALVVALAMIPVYLIPHGALAITAPAEQWSQTYGGTALDEANCVAKTSDGGYIVAGLTNVTWIGSTEVGNALLVKTNASGVQQWAVAKAYYGGTELDEFLSAQQTADGGYIAAGFVTSDGAVGRDAWLVKTNASGVNQWSKTYGGAGDDEFNSVQVTSDGGYILAGTTVSSNKPAAWLVKTDASGNITNALVYGPQNAGFYADYGSCARQATDGGYILAGTTWDFSSSKIPFLIKTDSSLSTITGAHHWGSTNTSGAGGSCCVQQTSDGGYILVGSKNDQTAIWLIKADSFVNPQWDYTFGSSPQWDSGESVQQTSDGGYIVAGEYAPSEIGGPESLWLIKTNASGNEQWDEKWGGTSNTYGTCVLQTADLGYVVAGWTDAVGNGNALLVKFAPEAAPTTYEVDVSSNPAAGGSVAPASGQYLGSTQFTATANLGYQFVDWTINGVEGSTTNPLTLDIESATTLVANFSPITPVAPVPELPTGLLLGMGLVSVAGIGVGLSLFRRRRLAGQ